MTGDYANRVATETLGLSPGLTADVNAWVQEYEDIRAEVYPDDTMWRSESLRETYDHSERGDELVRQVRDELGRSWQVERIEGDLFRPARGPYDRDEPRYFLNPDHPEVRNAPPLTGAALQLTDEWDKLTTEAGSWAAEVHLVALDDRPVLERAWGRLEASGHPQDELPNQTVKTRQAFDEYFRDEMASWLGREVLIAMLTRSMAHTAFAPIEHARRVRALVDDTWQLLGSSPSVRTNGAWVDSTGTLDVRTGPGVYQRSGHGGLTSATFEASLIAHGNGYMLFVIVTDED